MNGPNPPDEPTDPGEERIDLLSDGAPLPREVPVRPRELDLIRPDPAPEPAPNTKTSLPRAPASAPPKPEPPATPAPTKPTRPSPVSGDAKEDAADGPVLCHRCKYDLRGRPGGARCPECGEIIRPPKRIRIVLPEGQRKGTRDALFDAWQLIAGSALASIVLISPFVYSIPVGVAIASCIGFASAFRLSAIRSFAELPAPLREPLEGSIAWWRRLERAQTGIAIVITAGGLLSTVGVVGPRAIPAYYFTLAVWWALASATIVSQVRIGDRLSRSLVDPDVLPLEAAPRTVRWMRLNALIGAAGGLLAVYCTISWKGARLPFADTAGQAATLALLGAMIFQCFVALHARAHAILVANCVFESEYFRAGPLRRASSEPTAEPDGPDAVPPAKRHSFTPRGDDAPIELPVESPKE